jgi:signal recognition particle receptor subunit beta
MALVNHAKREINAKIVLCGPAGAGKATLLKAICSRLPIMNRGQLRSMSLQQDKMLFFDFTHALGGDTDKYALRLHVYTITGEVTQASAWKMVLKGVDGVAFVADSSVSRQDANRQACEQMQAALSVNGKQLEDMPAVVICSKQDLPESLPLDQLDLGLQLDVLPVFPVNSLSADAVLDPLCELLEGVIANLEGIGLSLQPAARGLCELSPARAEKMSVDLVAEPSAPVTPLSEMARPLDDESPVLSFAGAPTISSDGILSIGLNVTCCGKSSKASLKISINGY